MLIQSGNGLPTISISICILTCNRDELLQPLLEELKRQSGPSDEILVLDTGASDITRDLICAVASGRISYFPFAMDQFDFATARNELLRHSSCDGVVFIDDDAFPFPDWLNQVRIGLVTAEAAGGITVAGGEMPDWWDPEINWCIGLSPPGTALGKPGYYPDTCNMAADGILWKQHPFKIVSRKDRQLYATGREDAEWWLDRRLAGRNMITNYRQAVEHHVHADRIDLDYIKRRARNDGISSWLRRPHYEAATAIPWDLAHTVGVVADKIIRRPLDRQYRLADVIWMHRQWGKFLAVWQGALEHRPRRREQLKQLGKAGVFQLRVRAGETAFKTIKAARRKADFPPAVPNVIFVSADCHVGDSILLRRHIQAVAKTFPSAEILASCRYPFLLDGLAPNVKNLPTEDVSQLIRNREAPVDAAIVPYFPFGDFRLWREVLSPFGTTFDCDVSFAGRRDYLYARRIVQKNLELHEHENLARLFRIWPLRNVTPPPPPPVTEKDLEWVAKKLKSADITGKYVVVQFGAGFDYKEWPLDYWIPFLRDFGKGVECPIVIAGANNWSQAADVAVREVNHAPGIINLIPDSSLGQLMALIKQAEYFIGGCSGPKNIAMAFNVPTFTIYAATEPYRWGASENHHLHAYMNALPQKLTAMELQGLDRHHRVRLLQPDAVAQAALAHYRAVTEL